MTTIGTAATPLLSGSVEAALHGLETAMGWVLAAKRTRSPELIARAERDLHAAVDDARDLDVQWGQIGSTLGIARGNAYQRYRKRLSDSDFHDGEALPAMIA